MTSQTENDTFNKFNSLIQQAANAIACGPDCQRENKTTELKQNFLSAKVNLQTAPNQVQVAAKNYYTFTKGESGYNEVLETQLREKAELIANTFEENFEKDANQTNTKIDTYNGLLINFTNVFDLYTKYKLENKELEKEVKDTTSDILTNDRKTFYEEQGITSLNYYFSFIRILYIIMAISLTFCIFILPSQVNMSNKIIAIIFLVVYPFISTKILAFVIDIYYKLINVLPKNVHRTI